MFASHLKLSFLFAIAVAVGSTPSCADNNQSIFIRQVQALVGPDCVVENDETAVAISSGRLDLALNKRYVAWPLVGSQLLGRGDSKQSRAESNRVQINGAEVALLDSLGNTLVDSKGSELVFSVVANGIIDATTSTGPAYGITAIDLIPPSMGDLLATTYLKKKFGATKNIQAAFKVFGRTLGGQNVESGEFVFPIELCYGCGVTFPADAVDATFSEPANCRAGTDAAGSLNCRQGQDTQVTCRVCQGSYPACTPCSKDATCAPFGTTCNLTYRRCNG